MLTSQARIRVDLDTAGYYTEGVAASAQAGIDGNTEKFKIAVSSVPNTGISGAAQLEINPNANAAQVEVTLQSFVGQMDLNAQTEVALSSVTSSATVQAATDIHLDATGDTFVSSLAAGGTVFATVGTGQLTVGTPVGQTDYFKATLSVTQNNVTGDGTIYDIVCDNVVFDDGGNYNNATGEYTAAANGIYCFMATVSFENINVLHNDSWIQFIVGAGGQIGPRINPGTAMAVGGVMNLTYTTMFSLIAGNTVVLALVVDGNALQIGVTGGGNATTFTGFRIA